MHKAGMRGSETFEQTVHRQEQNRMCMASMRESAAPRVWHFSAFHFYCKRSKLEPGTAWERGYAKTEGEGQKAQGLVNLTT